MFEFLDMMDNHEERAVDNYEKDGVCVDTCLVTDADQPYETGVIHPNYNDGKWIIVELYDTKEEAQIGHDKWVKTMTAKKLPKNINDASSCGVVKFAQAVGVNLNESFEATRENCKPT